MQVFQRRETSGEASREENGERERKNACRHPRVFFVTRGALIMQNYIFIVARRKWIEMICQTHAARTLRKENKRPDHVRFVENCLLWKLYKERS